MRSGATIEAPPLADPRAVVDAIAARRRAADPARVMHDTPWRTARLLAEHIASVPGCPQRWGDPCVGAGRLIVAGWDALVAQHPPDSVRRAAFGFDTDPDAVAGATCALALCSAHSAARLTALGDHDGARALAAQELEHDAIRLGDALDELGTLRGDVRIVTNPPWMSARTMRRELGVDAVSALRARFATCRGAFDLGVPIVQACLDASRDGAFCAVVPATWASAAYAARLRDRMAADGCWQVLDGDVSGFDAQVSAVAVARVPAVAPGDAWRWAGDLNLPGCVRLDSVARVVGGLPGFEATEVARSLVEAGAGDVDGWPFVTTACVRPWCTRDVPVRVMGRRLDSPVLPRRAVGADRARDYDARGLLVPSVFRRVHAAVDEHGVATGVGVMRVIPGAAPWTLLAAILNSGAADRALAAAFPGASLSGGYRRITTAALRALPVPSPDRADVRAEMARVDDLVAEVMAGDLGAAQTLDDLVDAWYGDALALRVARPHGSAADPSPEHA